MNILIADSGSSKTEWALTDGHRVQRCVTPGINPVHMNDEEILRSLRDEFTLSRSEIGKVYFYGAGYLTEKQPVLNRLFSEYFGTSAVNTESDLIGAARGLFGTEPGIVAILGTGSNTGHYDGRKIVGHVPPLGYVLGDEGSGAVLGKKLLGRLLKGMLPKELSDRFYDRFSLTYTEIIDRVYRRPGANRFLAGFCPFILENIAYPELDRMVEEAFGEFVRNNLMPYDAIRERPVRFCGSVAWHFMPQLEKALFEPYRIQLDSVEKSPVDGLVRYHRTENI